MSSRRKRLAQRHDDEFQIQAPTAPKTTSEIARQQRALNKGEKQTQALGMVMASDAASPKSTSSGGGFRSRRRDKYKNLDFGLGGKKSARNRRANGSTSSGSSTQSNQSSTSDKEGASAAPSAPQASEKGGEKVGKPSSPPANISAPSISRAREGSKFSKMEVVVADFELPVAKRATPRMSNARRMPGLDAPDDIDHVRAMAVSPPMPPPSKSSADSDQQFQSSRRPPPPMDIISPPISPPTTPPLSPRRGAYGHTASDSIPTIDEDLYAKIQAENTASSQEVQNLKTTIDLTERERDSIKAELETAQRSHSEELSKLKSDHNVEISSMQRQHADAILKLKDEHNTALSRLQMQLDQHKTDLQRVSTELSGKADELARRDETNKKLAADVHQLREEIARKDAANSTIPARESQLSRKVAELQKELTKALETSEVQQRESKQALADLTHKLDASTATIERVTKESEAREAVLRDKLENKLAEAEAVASEAKASQDSIAEKDEGIAALQANIREMQSAQSELIAEMREMRKMRTSNASSGDAQPAGAAANVASPTASGRRTAGRPTSESHTPTPPKSYASPHSRTPSASVAVGGGSNAASRNRISLSVNPSPKSASTLPRASPQHRAAPSNASPARLAGWQTAIDQKSNRAYFYNKRLNITQWSPPEGWNETASQASVASPRASAPRRPQPSRQQPSPQPSQQALQQTVYTPIQQPQPQYQQPRPQRSKQPILMCVMCGRELQGRYLDVEGQIMHVECLCCSKCGALLPEDEYYSHNSRLYCATHYKQARAPRCGGCGELILQGAWEALGRRWHRQCLEHYENTQHQY